MARRSSTKLKAKAADPTCRKCAAPIEVISWDEVTLFPTIERGRRTFSGRCAICGTKYHKETRLR